jgi:hypothetical protein
MLTGPVVQIRQWKQKYIYGQSVGRRLLLGDEASANVVRVSDIPTFWLWVNVHEPRQKRHDSYMEVERGGTTEQTGKLIDGKSQVVDGGNKA